MPSQQKTRVRRFENFNRVAGRRGALTRSSTENLNYPAAWQLAEFWVSPYLGSDPRQAGLRQHWRRLMASAATESQNRSHTTEYQQGSFGRRKLRCLDGQGGARWRAMEGGGCSGRRLSRPGVLKMRQIRNQVLPSRT